MQALDPLPMSPKVAHNIHKLLGMQLAAPSSPTSALSDHSLHPHDCPRHCLLKATQPKLSYVFQQGSAASSLQVLGSPSIIHNLNLLGSLVDGHLAHTHSRIGQLMRLQSLLTWLAFLFTMSPFIAINPDLLQPFKLHIGQPPTAHGLAPFTRSSAP
ncbi:hypothetical protein L7F22_023677 [Adiantum nelumboides]|nr:hypothetical protein [Adiantum nelumboides]